MAPASFPRFLLLPFELRRMIYLAATPPRFVHVKEEHEDREAFHERFWTQPVQLRIHPSIAGFAHHWRGRLPRPPRGDHRQLTLDVYGWFTVPPRPRYQPWTPTAEVPEIPHQLLADNPDLAWEFVRSGHFYSSAQIPPLLHVCAESRRMLMDFGYELAFCTRTCGPRTWFNFRTDILYISRMEKSDDYNFERPHAPLLSGNDMWDFGQFDLGELRRVKRLALDRGAYTACPAWPGGVDVISSVLTLLMGLDELFLEEGLNYVDDEFFGREHPLPSDGKLWSYTPVLEVDALSAPLDSHELVSCTGGWSYHDWTRNWAPSHMCLKQYKDMNMGDGSTFFTDAARTLKEQLASHPSPVSRKVPNISIVHIGRPWRIRGLFWYRWKLWKRFQFIKEEDGRDQAIEAARRSIDVPRRPIFAQNPGAPPSPFTAQFQDDLEVCDYYYRSWYEYNDYEWHRDVREDRNNLRWLLHASIAKPNLFQGATRSTGTNT